MGVKKTITNHRLSESVDPIQKKRKLEINDNSYDI